MVHAISNEKWKAVRAAVREVGQRFAILVESAESSVMATADWSVGDTAAHVLIVALMDNSLLDPSATPPPVPGLMEALTTTTVDTVHRLNDHCLRHFSERDPGKLARLLREEIDRLLRAGEDLDPETPVDWLGGSRVPLGGLLAHLVNEMLIHGRDIARATGRRWEMAPEAAAMFFELFLFGLVRHGAGRLQEREEAPPERRIAVEFRSRYTTPAVMVTHGRDTSMEEPGRDVDVRLSFDPVTLGLMAFGRVSRTRAVLTGKVVVRGRRPWLLPAFLRAVRFPS